MSASQRLGKLGSNLVLIVLSSLCTILLLPHFAVHGVSASDNNSNTLRVHDLELVGQNGSLIAHLGASAKGDPELSLYDRNHTRRVSLFLEPNGTPDLYFWNSSGKAQLALDLYDNGYGNLDFEDADGQHGVLLEQTKNDGFRIRAMDGTAMKDQGSLVLFPRSGGGMALKDAGGRITWQPRTNSRSRVP